MALLRDVMRQRSDIARGFGKTRSARDKGTIAGTPGAFWKNLVAAYPAVRNSYTSPIDFYAIPVAACPAISAYFELWRGHSLFGNGTIRDEFDIDLRGLDCALTLWDDHVLGTHGEHNAAVPCWYDSHALARGLFERGLYYELNMG